MIILPIFKSISTFSMLMAIVACNSDGVPNVSILKYNTMLYITSETIFWTILHTMLHLQSYGLGYIRYHPTKTDIKVAAFILFISYIDCSAYYVTIDNPIPSQFLRIQMTYIYIIMLLLATGYMFYNMKVIN